VMPLLKVSSKNGFGMDEWLRFLSSPQAGDRQQGLPAGDR